MTIQEEVARLIIRGERTADESPAGQDLLLPEIVGAVGAACCSRVWLPFSFGVLAQVMRSVGVYVFEEPASENQEADLSFIHSNQIDCIYYGTPTIVNGKKLFPECHPEDWDLAKARRWSVYLCMLGASSRSVKLILSGLGSGDEAPSSRLIDMRHGQRQSFNSLRWSVPGVITWKKFSCFEDWLMHTNRID